MKIERPRHLQKLLERSLETGDAAALQKALAEAPAAEVESFLSGLTSDGQKRRDLETLLGRPLAPASSPVAGGQRVHDVRAQKQNPWWSAVKADPLPAPIHPEPTRDIDVHGERFTKDDVASLLRTVRG